jgi:hypothetical protein
MGPGGMACDDPAGGGGEVATGDTGPGFGGGSGAGFAGMAPDANAGDPAEFAMALPMEMDLGPPRT